MELAEAPEPSDPVVTALIRSATVEVIPLKNAQDKITLLPPDTTVTITCSPRFGLARTLEHAEAAAHAGYRVVPHLAARQVRDRSELSRFVARAHAVGVTDLYVIGGDADEPAGRYLDAEALLIDLADIDHGFTRIGVACHPTGHPKIDDDELVEALLAKQVYADYMVSQLCFDAEAVVGWLRRARSAGVALPLRIGLAAPMSTRKLAELSVKIGVGRSLRFLTKQHGLVGTLLSGTYRPEGLLGEIVAAAPGLIVDPAAVEGVHVFSFNQIEATVDWRRRLTGAV